MNFDFTYQGPIFNLETMRYNPCDDLIFPSIIKTEHIEGALGAYYLYYAPHDRPGGICLAYADSLDGPWTEYAANPVVERAWLPHYEVSHVSSPHILWMPAERKYFLYFHGENETTRIASTIDGIHFEYEGVAVSTAMYEGISEASYARVFPVERTPGETSYLLMFMGNNEGTRRIYAAWSPDGHTFEARRAPLISPPPGTEVTQVGAPFYLRSEGRNLVLFHGDKTPPEPGQLSTDIYIADVGVDFDREDHLGVFYNRTEVSAENQRVSDPMLIEENGRRWFFFAIGGRLKQNIAFARD